MVAAVMRFAKSSHAVEGGFLAAGVTVTVMAALQAGATLLSWIAFGF